MFMRLVDIRILGPVQTFNFTCAESNANEQNLLLLLISIRFGTCEVRREPGLIRNKIIV